MSCKNLSEPRNKYFFEIIAYANYINALVSDCNVITQVNGFHCVEFYRSRPRTKASKISELH